MNGTIYALPEEYAINGVPVRTGRLDLKESHTLADLFAMNLHGMMALGASFETASNYARAYADTVKAMRVRTRARRPAPTTDRDRIIARRARDKANRRRGRK